MLPPLLNQEIREDTLFASYFIGRETFGVNKELKDIADEVSNYISTSKNDNKYRKHFPRGRSKDSIGYRSLTDALNPKGKRAPETEKLLALYIIFKTFPQAQQQESLLEFEDYRRTMMLDLLTSDDDVLKVNARRLSGDWYLYMRYDKDSLRLPVTLVYNGWGKELDFKFKFADDSILQGKGRFGYMSKGDKDMPEGDNTMPKKEFWLEASNEDIFFSSRLHLDDRMLRGELLLTGSATYNSYELHSNPQLISTPIFLEKGAKFISCKDEPAVSFKYRDLSSDESSQNDIATAETNNIIWFWERRPQFNTSGLVPSSHKTLDRLIEREELAPLKVFLPQKPETYKNLKTRLNGTWYSLSRIPREPDRIALTKYEFYPIDYERNFLVKRYNNSRGSKFVGFIDFMGWHLYVILKDRESRRNRMIVFNMEGKQDAEIKTYLGLGVSVHEKKTLAWRELLIRFRKEDKVPEILQQNEHDNISYAEFREIQEISLADKLYLSSRNQATLSFPNDESSFLKQHLRQKEALRFCNKTYFVYSPYVYNDKYALFRVKLTIDILAQATAELQYPGMDDPIVYEGWVSKVNDTLRISVFNPDRQHMQILCNVNKKIVDRPIVLDGNLLSTDKNGKSFSDSCFLVESKLITEKVKGVEGAGQAKMREQKDDGSEYDELEKLLKRRIRQEFKFENIDDHFKNHRSIRHYFQEEEEE